MRSRFFLIAILIVGVVRVSSADTTAVSIDSSLLPFHPPTGGPLGIDLTTGLLLYLAVILIAILLIALWRHNIRTRS